MNITILGTGSVGQALAGKLHSLGHAVVIGTRDVLTSKAKREKDNWGNVGVGEWLEQYPNIELKIFTESVDINTELVIVALNGSIVQEVLTTIGSEALKHKILIDVSNPLDFSNGFPPSLLVCNDTSLGELIQQQLPETHVIKTLNTMSNAVMINPEVLVGDHTVFVSGDNNDAKVTVNELLQSFGWKETNIIDLGGISTARGTEMMLPLWVRLFGKLNTPYFNVNINHNKM